MKKLSAQNINELLQDYSEGNSVTLLSRKFVVAKATIYYHVRTKQTKRNCLNSYDGYIRQAIQKLEFKLLLSPEDKKVFIIAEINRLKAGLNIDRSRPVSDYIIFE